MNWWSSAVVVATERGSKRIVFKSGAAGCGDRLHGAFLFNEF